MSTAVFSDYKIMDGFMFTYYKSTDFDNISYLEDESDEHEFDY